MSKKSCIKTGYYPTAQVRTARQISEMIKEPGVWEVYRQTRVRTVRTLGHKWCLPKALTDEGKWRPIKNEKYVIGTVYPVKNGGRVIKNRKGKNANRWALWRMWDMKRRAEKDGKRIWQPQIYVVYYSKLYTIYYLICRKLHHSISGVY